MRHVKFVIIVVICFLHFSNLYSAQNQSIFNKCFNKLLDCTLPTYEHVLDNLKPELKLIKSVCDSPQGRSLINNSISLLSHNIIPLIITSYSIDAINHINDNEINIFISTGLLATKTLLNLYYCKKTIETGIKTFCFISGQQKKFAQSTKSTRSKINQICDHCTTMRFNKGEISSLISYYCKLVLTANMQMLPFIGPTIAAILKIYIDGELALEYRLCNDNICNKHRIEFFSQYKELSFSLGLIHFLTMFSLNKVLLNYSGYDLSDITKHLEVFSLINIIGLAHLINLPQPVIETNRSCGPIEIINKFICCSIDILSPIIKTKTELFLANKRCKELISYLPVINLNEKLKIFANYEINELLNDDIIKDYIHPIRDQILDILNKIELNHNSYAICIVASMGKVTETALYYTIGLPPYITKALIEFSNSKDFDIYLTKFKYFISNLKTDQALMEEFVNCEINNKDFEDFCEINLTNPSLNDLQKKPNTTFTDDAQIKTKVKIDDIYIDNSQNKINRPADVPEQLLECTKVVEVKLKHDLMTNLKIIDDYDPKNK